MNPAIALPELDLPASHGMTMRGWDFGQAEVAAALRRGRILNPAVELGTNYCPWNCDFCFTENGFASKKRKLANEMTCDERIQLIDALADLGARSINFVGAGEPTIDPDFFTIVEAIHQRGLVPIIYTEGSLKLSDRKFCEQLHGLGATIVLKVNSLVDADYQNRILVSGSPSRTTPKFNYFDKRAEALENLIALGFNQGVPTRLAFDTILCRENLGEIESLHRFARNNNIFILLVNYLPSGRSVDGHTNSLSHHEQMDVFARLAAIDREDYDIHHRGIFPYAGSQPCTIRGTGLFVKIDGTVLACPGETQVVGNTKNDPLPVIWDRLRQVRAAFDGSCPPRERFWNTIRDLRDEYVA